MSSIQSGLALLILSVWPLQELLKKALGNDRTSSLIASKFGMVWTGQDLSFRTDKQHVREACEASLKRLGTDSIDLYSVQIMERNPAAMFPHPLKRPGPL